MSGTKLIKYDTAVVDANSAVDLLTKSLEVIERCGISYYDNYKPLVNKLKGSIIYESNLNHNFFFKVEITVNIKNLIDMFKLVQVMAYTANIHRVTAEFATALYISTMRIIDKYYKDIEKETGLTA